MKKWTYSLIGVFVLIALDQTGRYSAEQSVWENRKSFFDEVVANADFSEFMTGERREICQRHQLNWGYSARTCFFSSGEINQDPDSNNQRTAGLIYWYPHSHMTSLFDNWWYYQLTHTEQIIMEITFDKEVVVDFTQD